MSGFTPKINADYMRIATAPRSRRRKPISEHSPLRPQVLDLQERQRKVLRLKHMGLSNKAIAERVGYTESHTSIIINSALGREHLAAMSEAADIDAVLTDKEIAQQAMEAHKLLKRVMHGDEDADIKLRVSVAEGYLGRAGFAPVARNQNLSQSHFSQKELDEAKTRAALAKEELVPAPENVIPLNKTVHEPATASGTSSEQSQKQQK